MPISSSALETDSHLRVLFMGPPKLGKTRAAVCTSPPPVRVILCESDTALRDAQRQGANFDFERARADKAYNQMLNFLLQAKDDAKAKKISTVVIDPFSDFTDRLLAESLKENLTSNGEEDGRRAYPHCTKRILHVIDLAFTIPAHLIVVCHYMEVGGGELGLPKTGEGIVPLIPGQARARVAARFNDVVWLDFDRTTKQRLFVTSPQGAWGPGCRSRADAAPVPADFTNLIKVFAEGNAPPAKETAANTRPVGKPNVIRRKP
jgi:hypothetical protein